MIILFDLDGTLIDSTEAILESFHHSFDVHGVQHASDEAIKALIGHPLDIMYKELGIDVKDVERFVATYKEHYRKISTQKTFLLPRAKEAIVLANEFASLGIVTTKTGRYSRILMEHFGVMHYFDVLIGREDVHHPKPHPEPVLKALKSFSTEDKEAWMIGDTTMDILAAQHAAIKSIAVTSGYDNEKKLKEIATVVKKDAFEAIKYLESRKKSHS